MRQPCTSLMSDKTTHIEDSDETLISSGVKSSLTEDSAEQSSNLSESGNRLKNRFELLESIGSGGMGTVYKAIDKRDIEAGNSSFIAIKIINDQYKNDPELLKALHNEARKTQSLAHPNIITVYDFDRDQDTVFMTMEFIDGTSLDNIIKANPNGMPIADALNIISKMCQALIYAHSQHLIHSDFKPSNVLISNDNQVKVFDFGIARLTSMTISRSFDPGVLGGLTPSYASLEMLNRETPSPRDDTYALACITYELLSGHHPFNRKSADIAQKNNLKPAKIKSLNNKQWNTLKRALSFNKKENIQDINTFLQGITLSKKRSPYIIPTIALFSIALTAFIFNYVYLNTQQSTDKNQEKSKQAISDTIAKPASNPQQALKQAATEITKEAGAIKIWTAKNKYKVGEQLQLNFTVDRAIYVRIASINSLGKVVALFPNPYQTQSYCKPGTVYQIPPKNTEFTLDIGEPRGEDMIIALGSSNPIPDHALNINQTGKIMDSKLRASLIQSLITYTVN